MSKKTYYDTEARTRVLAGAKELYEAVKVTLGPKGRNVVITGPMGPTITHDGITVAKGIDLATDPKDETTWGQRTGADLIREAAAKTNDVVGDGTTTATVLAYHILNEANKLIAAGHNPMDLRKGLDEATAEVLSTIEDKIEAIAGNSKRIAQVATVSAGDPEIGDLIAEVISTVGSNGSVTVEESNSFGLTKEIVEGFNMDRGYVSPYMVTDTARMEAVIDKPLFLLTDKKLGSIAEVLPLIEKIAQSGKKELVIIADEIEGEVLNTLVINKLKGSFNALALRAPGFGDRRVAMLQDIATLTGATIISDETGLTFENAGLDVLGGARKIIATKDDTTIIEGFGDPEVIADRLSQLATQIGETQSEYDKEQLERRMAALSGKVAVIKVGGATEAEIEEKKFRVDDAVAATKAAVKGGIVTGGGVTLVELASTIKVEASSIGTSREAGKLVLKNALSRPFFYLMSNAGLNADSKLDQVMGSKPGFGFDVNDASTLVDLRKAGIVDPANVTKAAITNAVSVAGVAMTMGALLVDIPEVPTPQPQNNNF